MLALAAMSSGSAFAETVKLVPKTQALSEFGSCIVRQAPDRSSALLATPLNTKQEYKLARQLAQANSACVDKYGSLSMDVSQTRGAIAEYMLVSDLDLMKQFTSATLAEAVRPDFAEGRVFVYLYAKCLAAADTPKSAAFIKTTHGSAEERQSFLDYGETASACMPLKSRYSVNVSDVRNHVAVALYEMSKALKMKDIAGA
jgi:hypothetical protein